MSTLQLTPAQLNAAESAQWQEILRQALADLRVAAPAIVQSFDATTQTVAVQIATRELVRTPDGPEWTTPTPIYKVPVAFPRAGGFALTMPLNAGDEGFLVFCDACIDLWWARGGVQNQFERRRHYICDCIFHPGPWSQPRLLANYSSTSAQLRNDAGSAYIEIAAGGIINIKAPGGLNIIGATVGSGEGTFNSIPVSTHLHTGVTTGGGDTGTPIP
jgi:hypothetical protein